MCVGVGVYFVYAHKTRRLKFCFRVSYMRDICFAQFILK